MQVSEPPWTSDNYTDYVLLRPAGAPGPRHAMVIMKVDEQKIILARKGRKVASIVNRGNERTVKIRAELFYAKICPVSSDGALRVRDGFNQGLSLRHAVQESFSDWSRQLGWIIRESESTTLLDCTLDVLGANEAEANVRK